MAAMVQLKQRNVLFNSIVGSSRRGWLTGSATSRETDYKPRIELRSPGTNFQVKPLKITMNFQSFRLNRNYRIDLVSIHL